MYNDGIGVAIILGLVALLLPAAWIAWWLVADLGEKAGGVAPESTGTRFHPAP